MHFVKRNICILIKVLYSLSYGSNQCIISHNWFAVACHPFGAKPSPELIMSQFTNAYYPAITSPICKFFDNNTDQHLFVHSAIHIKLSLPDIFSLLIFTPCRKSYGSPELIRFWFNPVPLGWPVGMDLCEIPEHGVEGCYMHILPVTRRHILLEVTDLQRSAVSHEVPQVERIKTTWMDDRSTWIVTLLTTNETIWETKTKLKKSGEMYNIYI